jgi:hypothetical protein
VPFDETALDLPVAAEEREAVAEVLQALGELPENQREALAMRELEGRSYQEIAETLGVTVPAVESLIFRARRTLRRQRTSLRGLTLVQLPRSLRTLFQARPDAVAAGLAAKAAVIVAAASVVAGGVLGSSDAGASQHPIPSGRHEPSRAQVAASQLAGTVVVREQAAVAASAPTGATQTGIVQDARRRGAAPAGGAALPPPRGVDAPSVRRSIGPVGTAAPAPDAGTAAPGAVPSALPRPRQVLTSAVKTVPVSVPRLPVKPALPVKPSAPVTVPSVPAVTVPTPPPVPAPPPATLPVTTVPSLPPPPTVTVTVPQPPSIPQVPGPTGIK